MTAGIQISAQLEEWGTLAGYSLTPANRTEDGRAIFWASLGEIRLFIGCNARGRFVITDSDRMVSEHFVLAAPSLTTIERYFFGRFCPAIRKARELLRVKSPVLASGVSRNFEINVQNFEGVDRLALVESGGSAVAVSSADPLTGTAELVKLSMFMTASTDEIMTSCLDPGGKPLFELP